MNRKLLKENAKIALKRNFWLVMLVVLVAQFFGVSDVGSSGGSSAGSSAGSSTYEEDSDDDWQDDIGMQSGGLQQMSYGGNGQLSNMGISDVETAVAALSVGVMIVVVIIVFIFAFVWTVFLTNPIQVGYRKFFMKNRLNEGKFADLFSGFSPQYLNIVKGMLTTDLIIFGWTLLFIIPGIIKGYQYFFVPFLLSENPNMSGARAREISTQMTDGYKWQIFVLALSFLGWELLAILLAVPAALLTCCFMGIGAMLVFLPIGGYVSATFAELYEERREFALCRGMVSSSELCGFYSDENSTLES